MKKDISLLRSLTILYAEDDQVIRDSIARILKMFFKEVFIASDGYEALEIYKTKSVNVIMLDYVMPLFDGYQTAKAIREIDKKIPIIIASAYTDKEKLLNAIGLNLIKYLEKPIMHEDLINIFNNIVDVLHENNLLFKSLNENLKYSYIKKSILKNEEEEIILSKNEILFLELMIKKSNQLVTKELIEDNVFKEAVDENTLRNMIYRLRKKIDYKLIITVKDLGYILKI